MKLKFYDHLILLAMTGVTLYTIWVWMGTTVNPYQSFNLVGALFGIFMSGLMLKAFIVTSAIFLEWVLPIISKRFKDIKIRQPSFSIFNTRIEIRITHKDSAKVTF